MIAGSFGLTYLDAKKIIVFTDDAREDIGTESEYDEGVSTKEEKKKEYAGYLQNFWW